MDQQDLPASLTDMTLRPTDQGLPQDQGKVVRTTGNGAATDTRADDRQLDQNWPNGPGGVCPAPEAAPPATSAPLMPAPLIPDQPMPPGAPASLAAIMAAGSQTGPELSTPSTGLSTPASSFPGIQGSSEGQQAAPPSQPSASQASPNHGEGVSHAATPPPPGPAVKKRMGRPHPYKPLTPMAIAEFAGMWHNAAYTVPQMARRYRCGERTIQDWRVEFGLPPRPEALKDQATVANMVGLMGSAAGMVDAGTEAMKVTSAMAAAPGAEAQVIGHPNLSAKQMDPLQDEVIAAAMRDIQTEAMIMTPHSDLKVLHRKLSRLAVLVATRAPRHTWDSLLFTVESLARAALRARQVEAMIPEGENDPVQLRKEAAGQMMQELKSVLTPEEQQVLAKVMKAGVDRLMAKGGDAASVTAGIDSVAGEATGG